MTYFRGMGAIQPVPSFLVGPGAGSSTVLSPALQKSATTAALDPSVRNALTSASKQDPGAEASIVQQQTSGQMAVKAANAPICRQMVMQNAALMAQIQQSGQRVEDVIDLCSNNINQFNANVAALGIEKLPTNSKYYWIGGAAVLGIGALWFLKRKR